MSVLKYKKSDGTWAKISSSGGGGASTYASLPDKPSINNVTLSGNKTLNDLGIQSTISDLSTIRTNASNAIPQGGTLSAPLKVTGGDSDTAGKIILDQEHGGQATDTSDNTLLGFSSDNKSTYLIGSSSYKTNIRGKDTRPTYNGNALALKSDADSAIPQGGTLSAPLKVTGGDSNTAGKIILDQAHSGQITNNGTNTLFGFASDNADTLTIGHSNFKTNIRGGSTRPTYNNNDLALLSDMDSEQVNTSVINYLSANPLVEPSDRGLGEIVTGWSDPTEMKYISTHVGVGNVVDLSNPMVSTSTNWRYAIVPCNAGDVIVYRGRGGSSGRAWAFVDSSNKLIQEEDVKSSLFGKAVVAPSRAAKLILNDQSPSPEFDDAVDMYIIRATSVPAKIQPLVFSDPEDMTFVPNSGSIIDLSARTKSTSANWKYAIVYCKEGDTFIVTGEGGSTARLWSFVGKNGEPLAVADADVTANDLKLVAPVGTYALVVNTRQDVSSYQTFEKVEKEVLFYSGKKQQYKSGKIFFKVDVHNETCNNFDISSTSLTPDTNPYSTSTREVNAMLMLPSSYSITGKPTKVIMIAHGASGYVTPGHNPEWYPGDANNMRPTIDYLLNKGYAIFDVDAITGQSDFGCPALVEAYKKAFEYIKFNYNVEEQLIIYGMSRGTWTSMTYTQRYRQDVRCMVICGPEESYDWAWNSASGLNKAIFAANFGFSNTSGSVYEADKMKPYDLYANIVSLNSTNYLFKNFPPMKWLFGGLDDVGGTCDTRSRAVATALRNAGNFVVARTVNNYTHSDICHLSSPGLMEEFVTFINKYE